MSIHAAVPAATEITSSTRTFIKMFSVRKRESEVWKHFTYNQQSLRFWEMNINIMRTSKLVHLAQDLVSAPASQAHVERVFPLCGILTSGRRSSMRKSIEMRVFLKYNQQFLQQTGFTFQRF